MKNSELINIFLTSNKVASLLNKTIIYDKEKDMVMFRYYETIIATRTGEVVTVAEKYYSSSTSALTGEIKRGAHRLNYEIRYIEKFMYGALIGKAVEMKQTQMADRKAKEDELYNKYGKQYENYGLGSTLKGFAKKKFEQGKKSASELGRKAIKSGKAFAKKSYEEGKEYAKQKVRDGKEGIAKQVLADTSKKVGVAEATVLKNASKIIVKKYKGGGNVVNTYRLSAWKDRGNGFIEGYYEKNIRIDSTLDEAIAKATELMKNDKTIVRYDIDKLGKTVLSSKKVARVDAEKGTTKFCGGGSMKKGGNVEVIEGLGIGSGIGSEKLKQWQMHGHFSVKQEAIDYAIKKRKEFPKYYWFVGFIPFNKDIPYGVWRQLKKDKKTTKNDVKRIFKKGGNTAKAFEYSIGGL